MEIRGERQISLNWIEVKSKKVYSGKKKVQDFWLHMIKIC